MVNKRVTMLSLLSLTAVAIYFCYVMAKPFLKPAASAVVVAIIFFPLHTWIERRIRRPNLAALASTILVILIVAVPTILLARIIAGDLTSAYQSLSRKSVAGGGWVPYFTGLLDRPIAWIGRYVDLSGFDWRGEIRKHLEQLSASMVMRAASVVGHLGSFLLDAVITFFTLFFLFREGRSLRIKLAKTIPLDPRHVQHLFDIVTDTVIANTHGVLVVTLIQGSLMTLAFWVLGLPSPLFWGVVTAFCSLIPVVGTALVWVPAAIALLVQHHWWRALILVAWGAGFVGLVDNIVRPYVVGGRAKMNTLFVFFALLGGVAAFGFLGLFIGPIILSVTIALLRMLMEEGEGRQSHSLAIRSTTEPDTVDRGPNESDAPTGTL